MSFSNMALRSMCKGAKNLSSVLKASNGSSSVNSFGGSPSLKTNAFAFGFSTSSSSLTAFETISSNSGSSPIRKVNSDGIPLNSNKTATAFGLLTLLGLLFSDDDGN
uniref:Predicted protein n=1 Tax=Hordeum vulgare subsp. vulgare TaxID=112509 RepID=F2DZV0_HORVV|nr:predicted protein [Hordeum vulgare subsp. vulgare]